jgi:hypothetical protein
VLDVAIEAKLLPVCRQPLADVLVIMRDTGMRNRIEVFTMRSEHVDWTGPTGSIHIRSDADKRGA